eukprot:scaffold5219_cov123-Isochrysis_galbana.AAC.1
MTRILAPWAKGRVHRGERNVGRVDRQTDEMGERSSLWVLPAVERAIKGDHRPPDPHAPPWGRALGTVKTPLQWNGQGRHEDWEAEG